MPDDAQIHAPLAPANNAEVVSPSDTVDFKFNTQRIYVGGTGNVAVVFPNNDVVLYQAVPAGTYLKVRAKRVNLTNTTATLMVAEY